MDVNPAKKLLSGQQTIVFALMQFSILYRTHPTIQKEASHEQLQDQKNNRRQHLVSA